MPVMSATPPVTPGQLVAGKYRVERVLGQGGMGIVVAAVHEQLHQRVAIKFLLPEVASKAGAAERFTREARSAVRIQSEHVARVLDVGRLKSGVAYMVMEYLEGRDLAAILGEQGTLAADQAVEIILQACEALVEAHLAGIVHRDLKPANLFITRRADGSECVKLLDFGISKATAPAEGQPALTTTTSVLGTPIYISPEQLLSSRSVDSRSDIWGLGVILYEVLGGSPPFGGDGVIEIAANILHVAPPSLHLVRTELPQSLCEAVMKCLEKRPEDRFADVGELALALAPFAPQAGTSVERITRTLSSRPRAAVATPASAAASQPVATSLPGRGLSTPGAWNGYSSRENRRNRLPRPFSWMPLWAAATLGTVALIAALGVALARGLWMHPAAHGSAATTQSISPPPSLAETAPVAAMTREPAPPASAASSAPAVAPSTPPPSARSATPRAVGADNGAPQTPVTGPRRNPLAVELK
jgi:eukaryotic-like serine/threonine-protein kinase